MTGSSGRGDVARLCGGDEAAFADDLPRRGVGRRARTCVDSIGAPACGFAAVCGGYG
jgi:hypothetical protein